MKNEIILTEMDVKAKIHTIRGFQVMIDMDLANLYGVDTKVLNQSVKRNIERFPEDFMFQLNKSEKDELVTNCDHLKILKFSYVSPYAFTEQGVAALSGVLKSKKFNKNKSIICKIILLPYIKVNGGNWNER